MGHKINAEIGILSVSKKEGEAKTNRKRSFFWVRFVSDSPSYDIQIEKISKL